MFDPSSLLPDEQRHFYRRTSLAALCLILVAGLHLGRVVIYDQTRWKGGGFGMFSTVDAESARFLKIYLIAADGNEFAIHLPDSLFKRGQVLRALPDQTLANDLAERLGQLRFERENHVWVESLAAQPLPAIVTAQDLPRAHALTAPSVLPLGEQSDWEPVPASAESTAGWRPSQVRLEVWRHVYDGERKQLLALKILETTQPAAAFATEQGGGERE